MSNEVEIIKSNEIEVLQRAADEWNRRHGALGTLEKALKKGLDTDEIILSDEGLRKELERLFETDKFLRVVSLSVQTILATVNQILLGTKDPDSLRMTILTVPYFLSGLQNTVDYSEKAFNRAVINGLNSFVDSDSGELTPSEVLANVSSELLTHFGGGENETGDGSLQGIQDEGFLYLKRFFDPN